jgi:methylphosphotriester-DNA--protein-cysteine methyltransferase
MLRNSRSFLGVLIAAMIFAAALAMAADHKYVGSKKSDKYHYTTCEWAKKISPYNLVTFKSAEAARDAGYVPCKVCEPPAID